MRIGASDIILAAVLLIAIAISAFYMGEIPLTGMFTDTGVTTAIISSTTYINFTRDLLNWSVGTVVEGSAGCRINTFGDITNCTGFNIITGPLVIENIGNTNVSLQLVSSKDAAAFVGGTNPRFQYNVSEGEGNSCLSVVGATCDTGTPNSQNPKTLTDVNTTMDGTIICPCFQALDGMDELNIDIEIFIPSDSPPTEKMAVLTATATAL